MDDENQTGQGSAVPPQAKEETNRGATHARKAAEDLRSAAGAMADEYREGFMRGYEVALSQLTGGRPWEARDGNIEQWSPPERFSSSNRADASAILPAAPNSCAPTK